LKKAAINRKIKKLQKELLNHQPIVKPIREVAILNTPDSKLDVKKMEQLEKALNLHTTHFHIFTVKEKKDNFNELRGLVADISDLNILGNIKNDQIKEFLNKKYDLLIDFTGLKNELQKYFSLKIQSGFRVGYKTDENIYDLMLEIEYGNLQLFIKEMQYYLKILHLI
jgi:GTPase involved in cell partitioning and DNA repair